jgi:DNA invertase Pin-like site-specific DNA recombinase
LRIVGKLAATATAPPPFIKINALMLLHVHRGPGFSRPHWWPWPSLPSAVLACTEYPKGRDHRPAFDALCKDATRRRFNLAMAWSVDRLGRSLQDLVASLTEIRAAGVDLFLQQQGLDTRSPAGRAMFQKTGVFAEFDRALITERVRAGLERFKEQSPRNPKKRKTLGRLT